MRYLPLLSLLIATVSGTALAADRPVTIRFAGALGGTPFACGQPTPGIGKTGATVVASDFRFYVSGLALVNEAGKEVPVALDQGTPWQHADVALVDLRQGTGPCAGPGPRTEVTGHVPEGHYKGVRFTMGVPFALNHADATVAPAPLNVAAMFWTWQMGYKFLKVDLTATTPEERRVLFALHIGSTGCGTGGPGQPPVSCSNPNSPRIDLADFDPDRDQVVADPAALLTDSDVTETIQGTAPGCMSAPTDPKCLPILPKLGLPIGNHPAEAQRLFQVAR
ncbi:putative repeat protein (TIGR04052 family) [Nitrospirillum amazonense]|uniref:Putative repeat protein (TIGR04052 family) n=1 Tax=Nitrospirillum amazonense TaxID=28077 RepID=A0A560FP53_9PROT|nr:MbnP family copper-binding protein [Nitrospirillum amazonense]TWB23403.1 putative repeat protein (TIGR04052 family) [Nitrospirillum amazonense]